jgi:hypothetical protein
MNYEGYKTLTDNQKQEYNWRFKDKPEIQTRHLYIILIIFSLIISVLAFSTYLIIENDDYTEEQQLKIKDIFITMFKLSGLCGTVMAISVIIDIIVIVVYEYNYRKWKNNNNIRLDWLGRRVR